MNRTFLKRAAVIFWAAGIAAWCGDAWLDGNYRSSMPHSPTKERPVELRLYHGKKVFVTQQEFETYQMYTGLGTALFIGGCLGGMAYAWIRTDERKAQRLS